MQIVQGQLVLAEPIEERLDAGASLHFVPRQFAVFILVESAKILLGIDLGPRRTGAGVDSRSLADIDARLLALAHCCVEFFAAELAVLVRIADPQQALEEFLMLVAESPTR